MSSDSCASVPTEQEDNVKNRYAKILDLNGIQEKISSVNIVIPKLSDDFTADYETVTIHFENEPIIQPLNLFVKKFLVDNEDAKDIREMELFEKEEKFFNHLIPHVNHLCRDQMNEKLLEKVVPKCYHADENVIVLDDLKSKGFVMLEENETHTFSRAKKVVETLARFHASSYALIKSMGLQEFLLKFPFTREAKRWTEDGRDSHECWLNRIVSGCLEILKKFPTEGSSTLIEFLSNYQSAKSPFDTFKKYFEWENSNLYKCDVVVDHGDAWNCNFMFNDPEEECVIIDFQTIHLGSPALDLVYYFYLTLKHDVRRDDWKKLLEIYYTNFKEHVETFQYSVNFTLEDLVHDYLAAIETGLVPSLDPVYFFDWDESVKTSEYMDKILNENKGEFYAKEIVSQFEHFQELKKLEFLPTM